MTTHNIYTEFKGRGLKLCGAYFWTRPISIILDLDLAKDILVKDFSNFVDRNLYYNKKDDPLSANLGTLDGQDWRKLRAKLTSTFTSGKMKFMFPTVVQVCERLRDCLKNASEKEDCTEMKDFLSRFSVDVIGTCAFGIECNSLKDPQSEFITICRLAVERPRHGTRFLALITSFPKSLIFWASNKCAMMFPHLSRKLFEKQSKLVTRILHAMILLIFC